jgi:AcrR family transcriptional regulator
LSSGSSSRLLHRVTRPLLSRRERLRSEARAEAKSLALQQLVEAGPSALSLNAIARQMGLTGPALYRYFADRDALLAELVVDAYEDLAAAMSAAADEQAHSPASRFRAFTSAYRTWAIAQPHRYRLLFGAPVPGFAAHSKRIVAASRLAMDTLLAILADLEERKPAEARAAVGLDAQLLAWAGRHGDAVFAPATLRRAVVVWSRLHGLISLEIGGNFASMGIDAARLFEAEVDELVHHGRR